MVAALGLMGRSIIIMINLPHDLSKPASTPTPELQLLRKVADTVAAALAWSRIPAAARLR